jgi:hypothetical protein
VHGAPDGIGRSVEQPLLHDRATYLGDHQRGGSEYGDASVQQDILQNSSFDPQSRVHRLRQAVHVDRPLRSKGDQGRQVRGRPQGVNVVLDDQSVVVAADTDDVLPAPLRHGGSGGVLHGGAGERAAGACWAKPVRIGHRVWIGAGVHINQGVTIGDGSIVGSGSAVTKDIPAAVIAAGVPAKVVRPITERDRTGCRAA